MRKEFSPGGIRKRDGRWVAYVSYQEETVDGEGNRVVRQRQVTHSLGISCGKDADSHEGERLAREKFNKWRHKLVVDAEAEVAGELDRRDRDRLARTLADYSTEYVGDLESSQSIERSTVADYRATLTHITQGFGDTRLFDLTSRQIRDYEAELLCQGLSPSTVGKSHRLLHGILERAVADGLIAKNPVAGVKPPKRGMPKPNSLDAAGRAELVRRLDAEGDSVTTIAARIALFTGAREGEVCGLQWKDVTLSEGEGFIWIRQSIGRGTGGAYLKSTKTEKARDVPVSPSLAQALARWKKRRGLEWGLDEGEMASLYVIGSRKGGYASPNRLCHDWKAISEGWGLVGTEGRRPTFHDLRHTFATAAITSGIDVKTVSSILGHANAAITLNIYASSDPDAKRRAGAMLDCIIGGNVKGLRCP